MPGKSYVVSGSILPDSILHTALAKDMLERGDALTVSEAVKKAGISRSAFYKYRDGIRPYAGDGVKKVTAITLVLEHRPGVLYDVLSCVSSMEGYIDSFHQSTPVQGVVVIAMNIDTVLIGDESLLVDKLRSLEGVIKAEAISGSPKNP